MAAQSAATVTFWSLLDDADRTAFRRAGSVKVLDGDQVVVAQGENSDYLLVVLDGCVKVLTHTASGHQAVLALRGPGDLLGEQAGLESRPRSAALYAVIRTRICTVPLDRFQFLTRSRPGIARAVDQMLSRRLREADQHRALSIEPVPVRLAALLLELSGRYGTPGPGAGEILIDLPLSQEDLAGLVMSSLRAVSRVLEQWRDRGWIATGRQSLLLKSVDELKVQAFGG